MDLIVFGKLFKTTSNILLHSTHITRFVSGRPQTTFPAYPTLTLHLHNHPPEST